MSYSLTMKTFIFGIVAIYLLICGGMYLIQRKLMYHVVRADLNPNIYGFYGADKLRIITDDEVEITAWYRPHSNSNAPTIIYLHGNAEHIGDDYRVERYNALADASFGVLAISWRGYGDSDGTPDEAGLYADARAAIDYLHENNDIPYSKIIMFGESLGSGVAVQMATEYELGGIMLDSPYTSIMNRSIEIYPWLPVKLLIKDKYESFKKIASRHPMPLVIFHGAKDDVVPIHHGKKLLEIATEPKTGIFYDDVEHVEAPVSDVVDAVLTNFMPKK